MVTGRSAKARKCDEKGATTGRSDRGTPHARLNLILQSAANAIVRSRIRYTLRSVVLLWEIGDIVLFLRELADPGSWRRMLTEVSAAVGVHPASLDEAARASAAFPPSVREKILARFDSAKVSLTPSQVILLARAAPSRRNRGLELILANHCSTGDLRRALRQRASATPPTAVPQETSVLSHGRVTARTA